MKLGMTAGTTGLMGAQFLGSSKETAECHKRAHDLLATCDAMLKLSPYALNQVARLKKIELTVLTSRPSKS